MKLDVAAFSVPKLGNAPDENEDAFARNDCLRAFAVADGATEGAFSRDWAKQLASHFVSHPCRFPCYRGFDLWLPEFESPPLPDLERNERPWFLEAAERRGSFSTLLGVAIDPPGTTSPSAIASCSWVSVGDSALFVLRSGDFRFLTPPRGYDFRRHPQLLPTHPPAEWHARATTGAFDVIDGDVLMLLTDALAEWVQSNVAIARSKLASTLMECAEPSLTALVEKERRAKRLRNDDTTLMVIRVEREAKEGEIGKAGLA